MYWPGIFEYYRGFNIQSQTLIYQSRKLVEQPKLINDNSTIYCLRLRQQIMFLSSKAIFPLLYGCIFMFYLNEDIYGCIFMFYLNEDIFGCMFMFYLNEDICGCIFRFYLNEDYTLIPSESFSLELFEKCVTYCR